MSEENVTDAVNEPKPVTVSFSVPDVWTLDHWETYTTAQADYQRKNPVCSQARLDYVASLALIAAGVVHVTEAPEKFKAYLSADDPKHTPLGVVGTVIYAIARPLERSVNVPLLTFLQQ